MIHFFTGKTRVDGTTFGIQFDVRHDHDDKYIVRSFKLGRYDNFGNRYNTWTRPKNGVGAVVRIPTKTLMRKNWVEINNLILWQLNIAPLKGARCRRD
jgi:hypothetical protein